MRRIRIFTNFDYSASDLRVDLFRHVGNSYPITRRLLYSTHSNLRHTKYGIYGVSPYLETQGWYKAVKCFKS